MLRQPHFGMNTKRLKISVFPVIRRLLLHPSSGADLCLAWDVFSMNSGYFLRAFDGRRFLGFDDFYSFSCWFLRSYGRALVRLGRPLECPSLRLLSETVSDWIYDFSD